MKALLPLLLSPFIALSLVHADSDGPKYYRSAVKAGPFLYVSGQNAENAEGKISGDMAEQTKASLESLKATLEKNGYTLEDVVNVTVAIAKDADFPQFNEVYAQYFKHRPARSTGLGVLHQEKGALVEITLVAFKEGAAK